MDFLLLLGFAVVTSASSSATGTETTEGSFSGTFKKFLNIHVKVLAFGRDQRDEFKIIVEQPFVGGTHVSDAEIANYMNRMGFELKNPRNWTYATPEIYLSDMHDENVIRSETGAICVVDCDIRINTPELRQGGTRTMSTEIKFL